MAGHHNISLATVENIIRDLDGGAKDYEIVYKHKISTNSLNRIKFCKRMIDNRDEETLRGQAQTKGIKDAVVEWATQEIRKKQAGEHQTEQQPTTQVQTGNGTDIIAETLDDILEAETRIEKLLTNINNLLTMVVYNQRR